MFFKWRHFKILNTYFVDNRLYWHDHKVQSKASFCFDLSWMAAVEVEEMVLSVFNTSLSCIEQSLASLAATGSDFSLKVGVVGFWGDLESGCSRQLPYRMVFSCTCSDVVKVWSPWHVLCGVHLDQSVLFVIFSLHVKLFLLFKWYISLLVF